MKTRFFPLVCLFFINSLNAQDRQPAPGMISSSGNFTNPGNRTTAAISEELAAATPAALQKHPDYGILPQTAPCKDCYEQLDKRTATTRRFVLNGTNGREFYEQTASGIINYKDANGFFLEKDLRVYATANPLVFSSSHQEEPVVIDLGAKQIRIDALDHAPVFLNNELELWGLTENGEERLIAAASWNKASVGSNGLRVPDIFDGITLEAFAFSGSVKTNFVIQAWSAAYASYKWLVIKDKVGTGQGAHYRFESEADANGLYNGDADVYNAANTMVGKVHQGLIYDQARSNTSALYYKSNEGKLGMYIDVSYLKNSSISYPVTVDPLISTTATLAQASITGSQYNGSCNFTNSCDYNLNVNSPANAVISDVTFSFSYEAIGLCYKMDGAMRIGYAGCVSPNLTGYYWFCNSLGGGMCNGTNISIFSDISSCIPAPSCASYVMPFVLKFYRSCYGASGCTANCIRAASPWVVNVFGKTLETLSNVTTGNGSTTVTSACSSTTTLNPAPANGISPYTFNWIPGGATSSTLGVPSVSTTQVISCTVTDACGVSRVATFTVNPSPSMPTAASLPTQSIACGSTSTITPVYTTSSTMTTYDWQGPGISGPNNGSSVVITQAGTYVVTFTNTAGCTGSATYTAVGSSTVATASAVSATVTCSNPTAVLAPTFTPPNDLTYSWTASPGSISGSTTGASITAAQAGVYQVVFTNTVTNCPSSASYTVTDDTQPPTASALPTQTITCSTPTVTLAPTYTPATGLSYSWTGPGLGTPATTASIPASQNGSYTVAVTAANGCSTTAYYSVVSDNTPASVSVQGSQLTCSGPVTLSTTINPTGTYTYTWTGPSVVSGSNTANPSVNAPGAYLVDVTGPNGCTANASYTVTSSANIPTASTVSGTITCTNTTVTLAPAFNPSSGLSYTWTALGGSTLSGPVNNASISVTQGGSYKVDFINTVTNCQSSATYTVYVDNQPPTVSAIGAQTLTCANPSAQINPVYTPGTGMSYSWTGPGINPPSTTAGINATQGGTYTVVATAANGCTTTAQYVVINNISSVFATATPASLDCNGGAVNLNVNVTPGGSTYTYTWTGPGIVSGGNSANPTVNATGNYQVTVTDANGCSTTATVNVGSQQVIAAFTPPTASGSAPFNVSFTNQSQGANTFAWTFGDGNASTATNPSNTYGLPGTYNVMLIASNGICKDTAWAVIVVEENAMLHIPNVFTPNGDSKNDVFFVNSHGIKEMELSIFNRWGTKIHTASGLQASWDGNNSEDGTYYYVVTAMGSDGKTYEEKGTVSLFR